MSSRNPSGDPAPGRSAVAQATVFRRLQRFPFLLDTSSGDFIRTIGRFDSKPNPYGFFIADDTPLVLFFAALLELLLEPDDFAPLGVGTSAPYCTTGVTLIFAVT